MNEANYQWNQKASKCLREHHKIISIGDLIDQESDDDCNKACFNMKKRLVKMVPNIINPEQQTPQKIRNKNLDLTPNRLRRNDKSRVKTFNPDITAKGNPLEQVRLFSQNKGPKTRKMQLTIRQQDRLCDCRKLNNS